MIRYYPAVQSTYRAAEAAQLSISRALLNYKNLKDRGNQASPPPPMAMLAYEMAPTYTFGRRQRGKLPEHLLQHLQTNCRGADVFETTRGGFATFHGPGQLVLYPVLDLQRLGVRLRDYVCILEKSIIKVLGQYHIDAEQRPGAGFNGVWIKDAPQKIASVGVHVRRNVTTHGLALNVDMDPFWFQQIVPCNLDGVEMASMTNFYHGSTSGSQLVAQVGDELAAEIASRLGAPLAKQDAPFSATSEEHSMLHGH